LCGCQALTRVRSGLAGFIFAFQFSVLPISVVAVISHVIIVSDGPLS
jgi:hypothetical protein